VLVPRTHRVGTSIHRLNGREGKKSAFSIEVKGKTRGVHLTTQKWQKGATSGNLKVGQNEEKGKAERGYQVN